MQKTRTSIAVTSTTRAQLQAGARSAGAKSIDAFLTSLLAEHEDRVFWEALARGPQPTAAEVDEVEAWFDATSADGDD